MRELEASRDALREEIVALTGLRDEAQEISRLRTEIERRKKESLKESADTEEQAAAEYQKTKRIGDVQRQQELELARLEAEHQKAVVQRNRQAAEAILKSLGMVAVEQSQWDETNASLARGRERSEQELAQIREAAREELRREFNITRAEPVDVTELFYREQSARGEAERLRAHVEKQDAEIRRMREHIEREPQRIAAAIEAAKTQVQNFIEQGGKR